MSEPLRTCVVCRAKRPKAELIRVIRSPEGTVCVDTHQKSNGRGAYICRDADCIAQAYKRKALVRHLKTEIPDEIYTALEGYVNEQT